MDRRRPGPGRQPPQRGGARRHVGRASARRPVAHARRRAHARAGQRGGRSCGARPARPRGGRGEGSGARERGGADRPADRARHHRAHGHERRAVVVSGRRLRWCAERPAPCRGRSGRRHRCGHPGAARGGRRGARELFAGCPWRGAASLWQQADRRRAGRRRFFAGDRTRGAAQPGRHRDQRVRSDPEGHLVQAVGQHDGEPDQRADGCDHRQDHVGRPGAGLHLRRDAGSQGDRRAHWHRDHRQPRRPPCRDTQTRRLQDLDAAGRGSRPRRRTRRVGDGGCASSGSWPVWRRRSPMRCWASPGSKRESAACTTSRARSARAGRLRTSIRSPRCRRPARRRRSAAPRRSTRCPTRSPRCRSQLAPPPHAPA